MASPMFRKPNKSSFAKKNKLSSFRKRSTASSSSQNDDENDGDRMRKTSYRKRQNDDDDDSDENTSSGGGGEETTSDLLDQIRRERRAGGSKTKKARRGTGGGDDDDEGGVMHTFAPSSDHLTASEMATRTAEYHPAENRPGERRNNDGPDAAMKMAEDLTENGGGKVYTGAAKPPRNKFLAGPLKAPTFVRTTCRFDYQPDICKDYKDTGFCGFGDTCIYLHDRGDTLSGWQLERQWEDKKTKEQERRQREMERFASGGGAEDGGGESDEGAKQSEDGLPFACHICRKPFKNPVVTVCGHYFCEKCIMDKVREANNSGEGGPSTASCCPICLKDTRGVFNFPTKLVAKKRKLVGREGTWDDFFAKKGAAS